MLVDMVIFSLMAMRYKYVEKEDSSSLELTDSGNDGGLDNPNFKKSAAEWILLLWSMYYLFKYLLKDTNVTTKM